MKKSICSVVVLLVVCLACSSSGERFVGSWGKAAEPDALMLVSISKDGGRYVVRNYYNGGSVFSCELSGGSLKCGDSNVDFMESSEHITWRGLELKKLSTTVR
jgi:hypothetical protein